MVDMISLFFGIPCLSFLCEIEMNFWLWHMCMYEWIKFHIKYFIIQVEFGICIRGIRLNEVLLDVNVNVYFINWKT